MRGIREISFVSAFLTLKPIQVFMDMEQLGFITPQILFLCLILKIAATLRQTVVLKNHILVYRAGLGMGMALIWKIL